MTDATLGTSPSNPHIVAPDDWLTNGVKDGAWCKCCDCDRVGKSTILFDYYADKPGDKMRCEFCVMAKEMK